MLGVITFDYDVPDDSDDRLRIYGTTDPGKMASIDASNKAMDFLTLGIAENVRFTIIPIGVDHK